MKGLSAVFAQVAEEYKKLPESERDVCCNCGKSYFGMGGISVGKRFYCFEHTSKILPEEKASVEDYFIRLNEKMTKRTEGETQ